MKRFFTFILILAIGISLVSCSNKEEEGISPKPYIDVVAEYSDVNTGDWFEESVSWGVNEDIMDPAKPDLFGVETPLEKAQILLAMWKAAGSPGQVISPKAVPDSDPNSDISVATKWALDNKIISNNNSINNTATRLDAITYLWHLNDDIVVVNADNFKDTIGIDAVAWAKENNISYGIGNDLFGPNMDCTKAHLITFLYRAK